MSHDRHVMTLNAQVCRNTWITRVNIIVFWKKNCKRVWINTTITFVFDDIYFSNFCICNLNSAALLTAHTYCLQYTLIVYSTHWLLTAHTDYLQHTMIAYSTHWLFTAHTMIANRTHWLPTAQNMIAYSTHWSFTSHTDCLQYALITYRSH